VIVGVGVDLVEVARLATALDTWGERLAQRLFTAAEAVYCREQRQAARAFAARFAAKEAFLKALGTGLSHGIRWTEVEVTRAEGGRPALALAGAARAEAAGRGTRTAHLSLAHDRDYAVAVVVLEG
jgi:holo-[acyl-carrier protein] synthase